MPLAALLPLIQALVAGGAGGAGAAAAGGAAATGGAAAAGGAAAGAAGVTGAAAGAAGAAATGGAAAGGAAAAAGGQVAGQAAARGAGMFSSSNVKVMLELADAVQPLQPSGGGSGGKGGGGDTNPPPPRQTGEPEPPPVQPSHSAPTESPGNNTGQNMADATKQMEDLAKHANLGMLGGFLTGLGNKLMPNFTEAKVGYAQEVGGDVAVDIAGKQAEFGNKVEEGFMWGGSFGAQVEASKFFFEELAKSPITLKEWGESLLDSQQHLVAFNSKIAGAFGEAERRDILREVESGAATSMTTKSLSESMSDLEDELQSLKDMATNGLNALVSTGIRGITLLLHIAKYAPMLQFLKMIHDRLVKEDNTELSRFGTFMEDIRDGKLPNKHTRTPPKK